MKTLKDITGRTLMKMLAGVLMAGTLSVSAFAAEEVQQTDPGRNENVFMAAAGGLVFEKVEYKGHTYQLFDEGIKWTEAEANCEEIGGHLVTVTSAEEHDFCKSLLGGMIPKYCWIGATHTSGTWEWITGEPWEYAAWTPGTQPNGSGGGTYALMENCKGVEGQWSWDDQGDSGVSPSYTYQSSPYYQVTETYCYICEWDEPCADLSFTQRIKKTLREEWDNIKYLFEVIKM